jgi:pyruvate dehydrogenase E1 component beta subunit
LFLIRFPAFQAIRSDNPIIFFEHVLLYNIKGEAGGADEYQSLEKAEIVRSGTDCTIFTYSRMRYVVMQAVQELEKKGYNPEVIKYINILHVKFHCVKMCASICCYLGC